MALPLNVREWAVVWENVENGKHEENRESLRGSKRHGRDEATIRLEHSLSTIPSLIEIVHHRQLGTKSLKKQ